MTLQFGWWDHFEQRADMPLWQQYDERIGLIRRAEELGFYGYHIAEHHFTTLDMAPSPIVFLAAVAQRTSKIRLGTMVLCLPLYHPTRLIQEFCMIDQLSHGRFMPGVGRGVRDVEHELFGSDLHQTRDDLRRGAVDPETGLQHGPHRSITASDSSTTTSRCISRWCRSHIRGSGTRVICSSAAEQGMNALGRGYTRADRAITGGSGRRGARATILGSWAMIRW